ncbi:MAG: peptidylprolyl isomerase [Myxococcales bacterium]|nr:peptidylprolyl isomerase [Myxococcales bacterium]
MNLRMLALLPGLLLALGACGGKKDAPTEPAKTGGETAKTTEPAKTETAPTETKATEPAANPAEPAEPARITGPIAKVNGTEIPADAFYAERDKITARGAKIPPDRLARIEQNILKRLVEQELISQAVKAEGIEVPKEDIEKGFAEYKERFQSEEQFENYLKHGRVTKESIEDRIRERRALEMLLEKRGDMAVTDEAAKEFYDKNERFYTEKAGIRASQILIKLPETASPEEDKAAMEKVKAAQDELKKGTAFDEVAKKMSEGPAASKGGDLGFFGEGRMVKEFEDVAFKLKVGEVSQPVKTRFGYHLIKVTEKRDDRKKSFDEVKDQIVKSLKNKKFFTERRKLLAELEKKATIEKFLPEPPPSAGAPGMMQHGPGRRHPGMGGPGGPGMMPPPGARGAEPPGGAPPEEPVEPGEPGEPGGGE